MKPCGFPGPFLFLLFTASIGCGPTSSSSGGGAAEKTARPTAGGGQPADRSAFDKLDPADIPFAKRPTKQPKELVAVLGSAGSPRATT